MVVGDVFLERRHLPDHEVDGHHEEADDDKERDDQTEQDRGVVQFLLCLALLRARRSSIALIGRDVIRQREERERQGEEREGDRERRERWGRVEGRTVIAKASGSGFVDIVRAVSISSTKSTIGDRAL
jgi:hypothetical protein